MVEVVGGGAKDRLVEMTGVNLMSQRHNSGRRCGGTPATAGTAGPECIRVRNNSWRRPTSSSMMVHDPPMKTTVPETMVMRNWCALPLEGATSH